MRHICVGDIVKQHQCHEGMDNEFDSLILDEDKLLDEMEPLIEKAAEEGVGLVIDFHSCDFFPERWFDLILVLRANTDVLFDRLGERGYSDKKRSENLECEIMQVVLQEAKECYEEQIVHEVPSNTLEELESNVERIDQWCKQWIKDNS